jgi:hypothetical protein
LNIGSIDMKALVKPFAVATVLGVFSVLAVWGLSLTLKVNLLVQPMNIVISPTAFVVFSLVGALGAFLVSVILLRVKSPRRTGQILGWLVLVASIATPLSGTQDLMAIIFIQATHFAIGVPLLMAMNQHLPEKR